jgi:putative endonuclease
MKNYWVYILASQKNGTLYIGVTNNLARRVHEHQQYLVPGFTKTYRISILVHAEVFETISAAIKREKQLKDWNRSWKIQLIEQNNFEWNDLYTTLL